MAEGLIIAMILGFIISISIDFKNYIKKKIKIRNMRKQDKVSYKIPVHHYFECENKGDCEAPMCYCKPKNN